MHLGQSIEFRFPFTLDLGLQNLPGASASIPNFGFNLGAEPFSVLLPVVTDVPGAPSLTHALRLSYTLGPPTRG